MKSLKSNLLKSIPGIKHGFGSREEPIPLNLIEDWKKVKPKWKQVHGTRIVTVLKPNQDCGEADGFIGGIQNTGAGILTADCVPILLAKKDGSQFACVHAGWRGTLGGITKAIAATILETEGSLSNWVAAVGPSVGPCCYEVSQKIVCDFQTAFPDLDPNQISPSNQGLNRLDLNYINITTLENAGIGDVEAFNTCTFCSNGKNCPDFNSFRRSGGLERQISVILKIK